MDAMTQAYKIMNNAIDRELLPNVPTDQQEQGRCWSCALFCECQHAVGVDDMDTCNQWRE